MTSSMRTNKGPLLLRLLTYGVALHGLVLVSGILLGDIAARHGHGLHLRFSNFTFGIPLVLGFTLLYISIYLRKRKWTAWLASLMLYGLILVLGLTRLFIFRDAPNLFFAHMLEGVLLPAVILAGLVVYAPAFTVRSDMRSFGASARFILSLMLITTAYGVTGFILLDKRDFHQEISIITALHHTVDQFGLTTDDVVGYTRRGKVFLDSLSIVSITATAYGLASLFQPLKMKLSNQSSDRQLAEKLLAHYGGNSEDYFKLWPQDKSYFFTEDRRAGLAYGVSRGIALSVGDPFGDFGEYDNLLRDFDDFCYANDWSPAFVHTEPHAKDLYKQHVFGLQKIGEEAIVNLEHFQTETVRGKYFRQIRNKFVKQGYAVTYLQAPHSSELLERLADISQQWLAQPGRAERGFMMGSFSIEYMQQCNLMVLRDGDGVVTAFINQIPSYDKAEANFDLLRHAKGSLSNCNDFLLMEFIAHLQRAGFTRLNMGLCPLSGLDAKDEERSVIDNALRFVYANGDRFYSFSGLRKFKAKYDPEWSSRYIAYRGGIRGFMRTLTALNRAMKTKR